jgi:hypothetical protein
MGKLVRNQFVVTQPVMSCCGSSPCRCSVEVVRNATESAGGDAERHGFDVPGQGPGKSAAPTPARRGRPRTDAPGRDLDVMPPPRVDELDALLKRLGAEDEPEENEDDESVENCARLTGYRDALPLPEVMGQVVNARRSELGEPRGTVRRPPGGERDLLTIPVIDWTQG